MVLAPHVLYVPKYTHVMCISLRVTKHVDFYSKLFFVIYCLKMTLPLNSTISTAKCSVGLQYLAYESLS